MQAAGENGPGDGGAAEGHQICFHNHRIGYENNPSLVAVKRKMVMIAKLFGPGSNDAHDGNQLKAARALAGVEQLALADTSGVSIGTIRNMEACGSELLKSSLKTIGAVQRALELAGVEFTNGGEPGVKLKRRTDP